MGYYAIIEDKKPEFKPTLIPGKEEYSDDFDQKFDELHKSIHDQKKFFDDEFRGLFGSDGIDSAFYLGDELELEVFNIIADIKGTFDFEDYKLHQIKDKISSKSQQKKENMANTNKELESRF